MKELHLQYSYPKGGIMSNREISVLIIDDEPMILMNLTSLLEDNDFLVETATSGFEAVKNIANIECDIAIVDMRMQMMDGEETIKNIHNKKNNIKFILHTGSIDYQISKDLKGIGITESNIMYKPVIDNSKYIEKINEIIC